MRSASRPWRTTLFGLIALLVVAAATLVVRAQLSHRSLLDEASGMFVPAPEQLFHKDHLTALLLGIDYNTDNRGYQYSKGARSDTIMAVSLDLAKRKIDVVSVPRDMLAVVNGNERKINEAYALGGERVASRVIGSWLGLPKNEHGGYFDRYLIFKVDATKELISAIGGIDLKVEKKMDYDDNWGHLHIHFKPGFQHLNGDEAVSYSRFRHDEEGDPGRIRRQQQVIRATINKLKGNAFNDVTHIGALIGVFNRNVITNVSDQEKESLALHYARVNQSDVKAAQVPYVDTKETDAAGQMLIPDETAKAKIVARLLVPQEPVNAASMQQIAAIVPANVRVEVENGTGTSGVAARMAAELRRRGFVVERVGDADAFTYGTTVIRTHSQVAGVGEKLRSAIHLPAAEVSPDPAHAKAVTDATIIVGRDFVAKSVTVQ